MSLLKDCTKNKTLLSLSKKLETKLDTYLCKNSSLYLMPINKDKLQKREQVSSNRPKFVRPESWRYKRLETTWRKPKGIDNHQRKQKSRGRPGLVKIGYGTPKIAKGLHPSGYTDNLVNNLTDLEKLNPKEDGVRFGHSVGTKKRKELMEIAVEKKFKVFNARVNKNAS